MGWIWSDTSTQKPAGAAASAGSPIPQTTTTPQDSRGPCQPSNLQMSASILDNNKPLSRDEQAELEFAKFLEEFSSEPERSTSRPRKSLNPFSSSTTTSTSRETKPQPPSPSSTPTITNRNPSLTHPTTMSCRSAFDAAYHCQLPGGQFLNVYRYGTLRNCSELWSNFWFCMRTTRSSGLSREEMEKKIWEFNREREARKYYSKEGGAKSSEDVWEGRKEFVEGAMMGDWAAVDSVVQGVRRGGEEGVNE